MCSPSGSESVRVPKPRPPSPTMTMLFTIALVLLSLMLLSFTFASLSLMLLLLLLLFTLDTIREAMLKTLKRKAISWNVSIWIFPKNQKTFLKGFQINPSHLQGRLPHSQDHQETRRWAAGNLVFFQSGVRNNAAKKCCRISYYFCGRRRDKDGLCEVVLLPIRGCWWSKNCNKTMVNVEFTLRNSRNLVFEVFRGVPCLPTRLKSLYFLMKSCHMVFGKTNMDVNHRLHLDCQR